jgi:hypothetical protein
MHEMTLKGNGYHLDTFLYDKRRVIQLAAAFRKCTAVDPSEDGQFGGRFYSGGSEDIDEQAVFGAIKGDWRLRAIAQTLPPKDVNKKIEHTGLPTGT